MPALVKLKQDIHFNAQLGGLLDALKSIAAQQFQSLERAFQSNPACFEALERIAGTFKLEQFSHPFTQSAGPIGVIVVTSDTGLLGGLNQQSISTAMQEYRQEPGELIVVGERGAAHVRELGLPCRVFPGVLDTGRTELASTIRAYALNRVLSGHLAAISIVYPRALSFSVQRIELVRALPCTEWFKTASVPRGVRSGPLTLESPVPKVIEYLVWLWLGQKLFEVFGMSRLAELAARAAHLEGSSQELKRRGQKLLLRYFRERREVIDRNIRELFAAKSLYGSPQDSAEVPEAIE